MGIAIPRPAMRCKEQRIIKARLDFFSVRRDELLKTGTGEEEAKRIAFKEARELRFTRDGKVRKQ